MSAKKRFFKNIHKKIGNKSVNVREKDSLKASGESQKAKKESIFLFQMPKLPSISLYFTEVTGKIKQVRFSLRNVSLGLVIGTLGIITLVSLIMLTRNAVFFGNTLMQRLRLHKEMTLWENISQKYPTYRDASFQVAVLAYRLGETQKEKEYLDKTLAIDPNFEPAQNLEKNL